MHGLSLILALLLGQAPTQPPPPSPVVNAATFGANGDPLKDATEAMEKAFSKAGQLANRPNISGSQFTALVRLPGGTHTITRPLFVPAGVDYMGDGWSTQLNMHGDMRYPALVYGLADPRVEAADRPDLFKVLDESAAPQPGVRRGWSTARGKVLQAQFTSANIGRWTDNGRTYFDGDDCFVLDLAIVPPAGGFAPGTPLLGCGRSIVVNDPQPWCVWTSPQPGWVVLSLRTTDRPIGIAAPIPQGPGVWHITWQIDLKNGKADVWVSGTACAPIVDGLAPGQRLAANTTWPMVVGRQGFQQGTTTEPPTSLTLAGLHLTSAIRYRVGPGGAQLTLDGKPANDDYRYFGRSDAANTNGFLPFTDPPTRRWLQWVAGDGRPECVLVIGLGQGGSKPQRLADMQIWSRGPAVLLGAVLDWRGDNLRLQSDTAAGLGSLPIVMAYPVTLRGCTLSGGDAAVSLSSSIAAMRDCKIEGSGRDGIRLRGATLDATSLFAAFLPPWNKSFLRSLQGGEGANVVRIQTACLDFEDRGPGEALFVVEAEPLHHKTVRIVDLTAALTGPTDTDPRPIVYLYGKSQAPSVCVVEGVSSGRRAEVSGGKGWQISQSVSTPDAP